MRAVCVDDEKLIADYAELRKNVLKCREESDHWCDSYLDAVRKCFLPGN